MSIIETIREADFFDMEDKMKLAIGENIRAFRKKNELTAFFHFKAIF